MFVAAGSVYAFKGNADVRRAIFLKAVFQGLFPCSMPRTSVSTQDELGFAVRFLWVYVFHTYPIGWMRKQARRGEGACLRPHREWMSSVVSERRAGGPVLQLSINDKDLWVKSDIFWETSDPWVGTGTLQERVWCFRYWLFSPHRGHEPNIQRFWGGSVKNI